jgi:hypothetical protein
MGHQQRNRRLVHAIVGHAAEYPLTRAKTTVCARDDKVGLSPFSVFHQSGCNVTWPALDAMKYGVDPYAAK